MKENEKSLDGFLNSRKTAPPRPDGKEREEEEGEEEEEEEARVD
jgi:hypothetical protein